MSEIQQWAASRETSAEIAKAIFWLANGSELEAQKIWEDPTDEQLIAIWERVTKNGLSSGSELRWGESNLAQLLGPSEAENFACSYDNASDLMSALDNQGIESDQDWENETTSWAFPDGSKIVISGSDVECVR